MKFTILIFAWGLGFHLASASPVRCPRFVHELLLENSQSAGRLLPVQRCFQNVKLTLERFRDRGVDLSQLKVLILYRTEARFGGKPIYEDFQWMHLNGLRFSSSFDPSYHTVIVSKDSAYDVDYPSGHAEREHYFRTILPTHVYDHSEDPLRHTYAQSLDAVDFLKRAHENPNLETEISARVRREGPDRKKLVPIDGLPAFSVHELLENFR